jgi:hypothetical protein
MKTALVTPFDSPDIFCRDFICFQSELKDSFYED